MRLCGYFMGVKGFDNMIRDVHIHLHTSTLDVRISTQISRIFRCLKFVKFNFPNTLLGHLGKGNVRGQLGICTLDEYHSTFATDKELFFVGIWIHKYYRRDSFTGNVFS